jgi:hypothetical protein
MKSVCLTLAACASIIAVSADKTRAQDVRARVLIGVGTVAAGIILGTQTAKTEEKKRKDAADAARRAEEERKRREEQARRDASARLSSALGTRINTQVFQPSYGSTSLAKALTQGKLFRLGPGWGTSAAHCISYLPSVCSPCDQNPATNVCVVRLHERILNISGARIQ